MDDSEEFMELIEIASRFAREEITPWVAGGSEEFPLSLWRRLGEAGLLGVAVPRRYGGLGKGYLAIAMAGAALAAQGGNLGIGLSWMIHNVVARQVFAGLGTEGQRARYLPDLARGRITASISISEPEVGAHPKYLRTRAEKRAETYVLNGEKAYLTNGPFVDLYVVLAVTSTDAAGKRKEFSAFIVPKTTPGVTMTAPMQLADFRPSPHCGIRLVNCTIPAENMIGGEGMAYPIVAISFRNIEDVTMMGLVSGGIDRELSLLLARLCERSGAGEDWRADLGRLAYLRDTLWLIAREAGRTLDDNPGQEGLPSLVLSFRELARQFQEALEGPAMAAGLGDDGEFRRLRGDLRCAVNLAKNVMMLKQIKQGEKMLRGAQQDEHEL